MRLPQGCSNLALQVARCLQLAWRSRSGRSWIHGPWGVLTPPAELAATARLGMSYASSHRSNAEIPAGVNARRDYNAEGRRLVEALGLQVGGNYNAMDAIWKESSTGGKIYVGNETAARGPASTLAEHGITHVVNCTDNMPLYHQSGGRIQYYRFDIAGHWRHVKDDASAIAFTRPMFEFVGEVPSPCACDRALVPALWACLSTCARECRVRMCRPA